ncbi:MAG: hypothetical protein A3G32_01230 [Deltaproteobacteria bacterium RIFCSPLOWO2_12_FULL_40_28]|nr:MAG: hypothetical protein A3C45_10115 [Deltaproteobacteria bacterium RIFCSPHIGHO2_02_FULL_40_28]OGQ19952.1 MAG: hypothetical protein A3E27_07065 [Deltaproteobacteria bacterium RIFCSPHIGHO2_12_FULL_40_32]OGQ39712.1 MAG: hypothetical protein A3I69_06495 [Deltaproteobacteria bacterium RIFCSPLOWO2_02_FULL_40_36]OGQ52967.1 MAG: hypothetical protein A3G32_01230 [Deltaproteobacteria bacterium RIFCSPLOWO2_12_FULL_40_28]
MISLSILGSYTLALAFPSTLLSILFYLGGYWWQKSALVKIGQRATIFTFALLTLSVCFLILAFVTNDFSIVYVAHYSNITLPLFFKFAGLWAGLDGSILFWVWLVSLYSVIVLFQNMKKNPDWMPYINAVMMTIVLFFLALIVFANNPFTPVEGAIPLDGKGLNPLLQNIAMVIHPPSLYLGFTGFSVPFAFAIAALVTRRLDSVWIEDSRRWTFVAWFFLTMGNLLGAAWAYVELGWGGFWAWDPVENASFMPWLTATAYFHSVLIQKRRGMFAVWNISLICLTFILTLFGTFLTRSGVVESVHAFSGSSLGPYFLAFILFAIAVSTWLIVTRRTQLQSANILQSYFSKESAFVLNNIILVVGAFCVMWATMFPSLSEWITGQRITVGPSFFNKMMAPIGLILIFLMGFGPMVSWKKGSWTNLKSNLLGPLLFGILSGCVFFPISGGYWYAILSATLIGFVVGVIYLEFHRGITVIKKQKKLPLMVAMVDLITNNNRRYGGYLVHLGVLMIFVGIAGTLFKNEADFSLNPGNKFTLGEYHFVYQEPVVNSDENKDALVARVDVFKNEKKIVELKPARFFYKSSEQPTTEAAIFHAPFRDVYLVLANLNTKTGRADFRATINPLISFLWIGGIVILVSSLIVIIPKGTPGQKKIFKGGLKTLLLTSILFHLTGGFSTARAEDVSNPPANTASFKHLETGEDPFAVNKTDPLIEKQKSISEKLKCACKGCVRMALRTCTCDYAKNERGKILSMLNEGKTDNDIMAAFTSKYGLHILMEPPRSGFFEIGFILPTLALVASFLGGFCLIYKWRKNREESPLTKKVATEVQDPYYKLFKEEADKNDD